MLVKDIKWSTTVLYDVVMTLEAAQLWMHDTSTANNNFAEKENEKVEEYQDLING